MGRQPIAVPLRRGRTRDVNMLALKGYTYPYMFLMCFCRNGIVFGTAEKGGGGGDSVFLCFFILDSNRESRSTPHERYHVDQARQPSHQPSYLPQLDI